MANLDKNIEGGASVGRVIWLDPNKANNVMVNPEDLSINVDFRTTRKGRTLIFSGEEITSTENSSSSIGFIEGSKKNDKSEERSLTTRYTNAISLDLINPSNIDNQQSGSNDDYESLGIESIDIEFNTAYTPIIKIKFIDVRGNAILSQGNSSKYKMFFELPYPLFRLKVKGFYGKAVTYCLHLQRWNANFNSETGNFEIQADFIGYTYAFLTDMIIGLVRAASFTEKGKKKLLEKKDQYNDKNLVITIDAMLKNILLFNNNFNKIREENDSVKKIGAFSDVFDKIGKIKQNIVDFMNEMGGDNPPFKNEQILVVDSKTGEEKNESFEIVKKLIESTIKSINDDENIPQDLKINNKINKLILKTTKITKEKLEESASASNTTFAIKTSDYKFTPPSTSTTIEAVNNILEQIKLGSTIPNTTEFNVYTFKYLLDELNTKINLITEERDDATENLITDLSNSAETQLGFEPTIRNIFRVLTINTEVFLEILRDVSVASQSNSVRKKEIKKLFGDNQPSLNIHKKDIDADAIYAWPEYRDKDKNGDYVETYMGANENVTIEDIDELVFTEEMLKGFIDVVKSEDELSRLDDLLNAGLDIDSIEEEITNKWWPISVVDTPTPGSKIRENPYYTALTNSNTKINEEEIIRVLIMRSFLLLGISHHNNKIPFSSSEGSTEFKLLEEHAVFEANNIVNACRSLGENGKNILRLLQSSFSKISDVIKFGEDGSDKINNPLNQKKAFFNEIQLPFTNNGTKKYYEYTYIKNDRTKNAYIPINNGFDGQLFYSGNNFKTPTQLKTLSNDIVFVSNPVNQFKGSYQNNDDGSYLFKIFEASEYEKNVAVEITPKSNTLIDTIINNNNNESSEILKFKTFSNATIDKILDPDEYVNGLECININHEYLTHEFNFIDYTENTNGGDAFQKYTGEFPSPSAFSTEQGSTMLSFYTENTTRDTSSVPNGTYLCEKFKDRQFIIYQGTQSGGDLAPGTTTNVGQPIKIELGIKNGEMIVTSSFQRTSYTGGNSFSDDIGKNYMKNKTILHNLKPEEYFLPFIDFGTKGNYFGGDLSRGVSLFGSWFYNQQDSTEAKALLFLHTIPFQGVKTFGSNISELLSFDKYYDWVNEKEETGNRTANSTFTRLTSIKGLFQVVNGFIQAPKAWCLFIGGILWRLEQPKEPIIFKDIYNNNELNTLISVSDTQLPEKDDFLYYVKGKKGDADENPWGLFFSNESEPDTKGKNEKNSYVRIDKTLRGLPSQIKNEFINYFLDWVNNDSNGFKYIQKNLEIWEGYDKENISDKKAHAEKFKKLGDDFFGKQEDIDLDGVPTQLVKKITEENIEEIFKRKEVLKNYDLIATSKSFRPSNNADIRQFTLINKQGTDIMRELVGLFTTPVYLQNVNPNVWNHASSKQKQLDIDTIDNALKSQGYNLTNDSKVLGGKKILAEEERLKKFYNVVLSQLGILIKNYLEEKTVENAEEKQRIFGSTDDNSIKLQIYRTLSSINDKWVNGSNTGCAMQMCGENNLSDKKLAEEYRNISDGCPSLLDTFRFVDRAFRDIGDDFYLHLNYINEIIIGNYNQSFFDVVNQILTNNNFNFIALPTFFNFNDIDQLKSAFTPYSYVDVQNILGNGGPAFVCVYVGQSSKNLDLGLDSPYPDDGLSFNYDKTEGLKIQDEASDFSKVAGKGEFNVPVFAVNYGQQNQNYFKSLKLDQREFAETMESLQVIEQISNGGDKSKSSYAGNNLFNVYQTRSYSATIEMMGSAMIQPMMYFQLNNVPMFRGAYLIYKTTHSIRPHSMTTTVTGSRVKKTKTPLLDKATVYMNLVGLDTPPGFSGGSRALNGVYPPIVRTIIENGGDNGIVESGNIRLVPVGEITDVQQNVPLERRKMIAEAVPALTEMLKAFVDFAKAEGYPTINEKYVGITSLYRSYEYQKGLYDKSKKDGSVAAPGTSNHSWGIAVDLLFAPQKTGTYLKVGKWAPISTSANKEGFSFEYNPSLKWFYDNGWKYGFVHPTAMRSGVGIDEFWHMEYHGTAAKCIMLSAPKIIPSNNYTVEIKESSQINNVVKNPKTPDGNEAVYIDCKYTKINQGDGSDIITDVDKINNIKEIAKMLKSLGVTKEGTIGFIGNILGESNANPKAIEKKKEPIIGGSGGIGIVQWTGSRRRKLEQEANNDENKIVDLKFQIDFLKKELIDKYKNNVLNPLKTNKDIKDSTIIVLEKFERPATYLNRDKNPAAYQKTKDKRFNLALSAEDIVNEVYS